MPSDAGSALGSVAQKLGAPSGADGASVVPQTRPAATSPTHTQGDAMTLLSPMSTGIDRLLSQRFIEPAATLC
jgi:hypothetical protein